MGLNTTDGTTVFDTALPSNKLASSNGFTSGNEILPYENGVAIVNNGVSVYFYNLTGVLDASKTFSPTVASNATPYGAAITTDGRVYLSSQAYVANTNSYDRHVYYKDLSGTVNELSPPSGSTLSSTLWSLPSGGVVIRYNKGTDMYFGYYSNSGVFQYEKNLSTDTGLTKASGTQIYSAVDNLGNVIVVRTMDSSERNVYVDSFSPNGVKTRLFDSSLQYGTSGTDYFNAMQFSGNNLSNGKLYLSLCQTNSTEGGSWPSVCRSYNTLRVVSIPMAGSFSYPKSSVDKDDDSLTLAQEVAQGTSDLNADSDSDGLSDFEESTSSPNRNTLFCNSAASYCEYPDPAQRDLYIEVDWMTKPGVNGYTMQPTASQVTLVKNAFANHGINAHIDTGQLSGGNEVPYNSSVQFASHQDGVIDFYDYKYGGDGINPQFSLDKYHIYHYLISGLNFSEDPYSSGISRPGDDDTFLSFGLINETYSFDSFDNAIAGTMIHELGHTLCLTPASSTPVYPSQPEACRYAGVDNRVSSLYPSAMNYNMQLDTVDYSNGQNGAPNDHDDWSAIRLFDFANQDIGDPDPMLGVLSKTKHKKIHKVNAKPIIGPTNKQLLEAKNNK